MDEEFAIKRLKRVHDSAVRADHESAQAVVREYNSILVSMKNQFQENEFIQSESEITAIVGPSVGGVETITPGNALEKVKLKTEQISDSLGLSGDFERPTGGDEMAMINLEYSPSQQSRQEVNQEASPEMSQEVSVESVLKLIELDPQVQGNQEEIRKIVRQFETELESEDPDCGTLRQFIDDAKEYSTSVAAKLAMLGLQKGLVGLLKL